MQSVIISLLAPLTTSNLEIKKKYSFSTWVHMRLLPNWLIRATIALYTTVALYICAESDLLFVEIQCTFVWKIELWSLNCYICWTKSVVSKTFAGYVVACVSRFALVTQTQNQTVRSLRYRFFKTSWDNRIYTMSIHEKRQKLVAVWQCTTCTSLCKVLLQSLALRLTILQE